MTRATEQQRLVAKFSAMLVVLFGLAACQSGGVAVSSYNGDQFAEAIASNNKSVDLSAMHDDDRGVSARKFKKPATAYAKDTPQAEIDAETAKTAEEGATVPAAAVASAVETDSAAIGPTIVASLRSENRTALPGVGDPFAALDKDKDQALTRPTRRAMNGAAEPVRVKALGGTAGQRRARYAPIIRKHAKANGVPVSLAMAVVQIESMYRPMAVGRAGEIGLMQILPRTARFIGYKGSMKALHDPDTNIRYGMKYLGKAHRLGGGSVCGTILKYNAGHGAKKMNTVSRKYCQRISAILSET